MLRRQFNSILASVPIFGWLSLQPQEFKLTEFQGIQIKREYISSLDLKPMSYKELYPEYNRDIIYPSIKTKVKLNNDGWDQIIPFIEYDNERAIYKNLADHKNIWLNQDVHSITLYLSNLNGKKLYNYLILYNHYTGNGFDSTLVS